MPENAQTIPAPPSAGNDTASLLEHILNSNQSNLGELAKRASTPVAGPHVTEIPATMGPRQPGQPGQLDHREVVGAGNARAQGIGNSVVAVMNALSATETAVDNKKRQEVASATHTLITAQQAADQAKQVLQNDPNNQAAKEAYQQNLNIMNGILGQDKMRKAISKGMNIDFTDPKANDTLEHQGVAAGTDMAKRSMTYADQFNQKTPTTVAPNQQAIAQYQAAVQEQKIRTDAVKAFMPLLAAQTRAQTQMSIEQFKANQKLGLEQAKSADSWNRLNAQIQGRKDLEHDKFGYRLKEIGAQMNSQFQLFTKEMQFKGSDPLKLQKEYEGFMTKTDAEITNQASVIKDLEDKKQLVVKAADKADKPSLLKSFDDQLNLVKGQQAAAIAHRDALKNTYHELAKIQGVSSDGGAESNTTKLSATDASNWLAPTDSTPEDESDDDSLD